MCCWRVPGRSLLAIAAALVIIATASPANALVRTVTRETQMPLFWDRSPITITHDSQPQIRGMKPDQALAALRASAQRWSRFGNGCSSLFLRLEPTETVNTAATIDYVNRIVIRTQDWCNPLKPVKPPSPGEPDEIPCHDPWSLAVTSVTSRPADGSIIDADIELNLTGQNSFADLAIQPPRQPHEYDLESTMTHELGHLLGIAHSCIGPKDGPTSSKRDVRGAQVRDCEGLKPVQ